MMENYGANATSFAAMFGVQPLTIRRHIQMNKLNIKFPVGHSMSTAQKDAWDELLHGKTSDEGVEVEAEDAPATKLDEAAPKQSMDMKRFSLCFNGRIMMAKHGKILDYDADRSASYSPSVMSSGISADSPLTVYVLIWCAKAVEEHGVPNKFVVPSIGKYGAGNIHWEL